MTSQAGRNALNALAAARLLRVEARIRQVLVQIDTWQQQSWQPVLEVVAEDLREGLRAPVERERT